MPAFGVAPHPQWKGSNWNAGNWIKLDLSYAFIFTASSVNGIWVTSAGDMNAKNIIHLDSSKPGKSSRKWTESIVECLFESDRREATSIAFPALGTGKKVYTPEGERGWNNPPMGLYTASPVAQIALQVIKSNLTY